jgi:hypothetical protein
MPGNGSQYRVVSPSGKNDGYLVSLENDFSLSFDKESMDLGGIAAFKTSELLSQHGIESIGDHGHDDIKVYFDQDGGREGVEVKKLHGLRDDVFHTPSSGVVSHQQLLFQLNAPVIGALLYQSLITASFGSVTWYTLLKKYGAVALHSFVFIMPIAGVTLGGLLLGEPITIKILLALIFIVFGIFVVHWQPKKEAPAYPIRRDL